MATQEKLPPREGAKKARRINLIIAGIHNGLTYEEIQSRLNDSHDRFVSNFRGECSTATVKRIISQLPLAKYHITDIVEIPQNSYKDKVEKHDLEIITSDSDLGILGVQVKSSCTGVSEFYQHLSSDPDIAREIVLHKKLIVLNGSLEDSVITRNFLEQFQKIYQNCKFKFTN